MKWRNQEGDTALISAWRAGHWETVPLLVERGAPVDVLDKEGRTPLEIAILGGTRGKRSRRRNRAIEILLARGSDVNRQDSEGRTLLMHVAADDVPPAGRVELLLSHGADHQGRTALMHLCSNLFAHPERMVGMVFSLS